jgi:exodeoxyribonuclease V alpha subunit
MIHEALTDESSGTAHITQKQAAFARGDRVLHTKNNYQLGVFNGECGSVQAVNALGDLVTVQYGERFVRYSHFTLSQLTHGFAITIHRAQGSEYPFVVIPIHATQQPMLNRALLYTALTRARKMAIFVGSRDAFAQAIANNESTARHTGLQEYLRNSLPSISR